MTRVIERGEAHYEIHEVPFGRSYEWHPAYVILICDCGEKLVLAATSTITICRCGAEFGAFIHGIREAEGNLRYEVSHPWRYNDKPKTADVA